MTEEQLLNEPATESINGSECTTPIASKTGMKPAKTPISTLSQQFANKEQKPKYEFLPAEGINNGFEVTCGKNHFLVGSHTTDFLIRTFRWYTI